MLLLYAFDIVWESPPINPLAPNGYDTRHDPTAARMFHTSGGTYKKGPWTAMQGVADRLLRGVLVHAECAPPGPV